VRAAKAIDVSVKVQGWFQVPKTQKLWKRNEIVRATIPFIGIDSEMLVSQVRFNKSIDGTFTTLGLTRPDAYNPKKELKAKDDPTEKLGWATIKPSEAVAKLKNLL